MARPEVMVKCGEVETEGILRGERLSMSLTVGFIFGSVGCVFRRVLTRTGDVTNLE